MIISGCCTAFVCLVVFGLMALHATHLSRPSEQIKTMKVCLLIPLYTISSFLSICFPTAAVYLEPWLEYMQAMALGSFFLLLCQFISGDYQTEVSLFFAAFEVPRKKNQSTVSGLEWFRKRWIAIFQYPVVALFVAVATDITQAAGIYCLDSTKPYFAHIWLTVVVELSTGLAVTSVITFYGALKQHLASHRPLAKLLSFKLIVGLVFIEKIIFLILRSNNVLKESPTLSYADVNIGIPNMVICIQMVPFALFFPYAWNVAPYFLSRQNMALPASENHHQNRYGTDTTYYHKGSGDDILMRYKGGPLGARAWLGVLSPMEILRAIRFAFNMSTELRSRNTGMTDNGIGLESTRARESTTLGYGHTATDFRAPSPSYEPLIDHNTKRT
ncbi:organic solute transporter Ostalpha-domain-containing protein [Aspergillus bertholletiae]|uniref:Organic solute transporter Ostalpha-domain-containing protein n=1 Tax=Aspergillus bertholletiae TaxID=1226010 RepID=A0A5N7B8F3_9EURO|nr:organic solute transporter Ostalpha-domain-containing protein [Aspergillus bertholletiae]